MGKERQVILVSPDPHMAQAIGGACAQPAIVDRTCRTLLELHRLVPHAEAAIVLVDTAGATERTLVELEPIIKRLSRSYFVLLTEDFEMGTVLRAMRLGVRHCVSKDVIHRDLAPALHDLMSMSDPARSSRGELVTVLSAGGGCGATTLAVNLGAEMQIQQGLATAIVDLDCAYAGVASQLGLEARYGIQDVLSDRSRIDHHLVASTVVRHPCGLEILASPATMSPGWKSVRFADLDAATEVIADSYDRVVIDAPRVPMETAAMLVTHSAVSILALQLTVCHLKSARLMIAELRERGAPLERMVAVVCRYRKRGEMIALRDAEQTLRPVPVRTFGNDFATVSAAQNYGKPLAEHAPRARLRRDLQSLAHHLLTTINASAA